MNGDDLLKWCNRQGVTYADFNRVWPIIRAGMVYGIAHDQRLRLVGLGLFRATEQRGGGPSGSHNHIRASFKAGDFLKDAMHAPDTDQFFRDNGIEVKR